VPKVAIRGAFEELELANERGHEPSTLVHLVGGQPLSPTATRRLRQVREWVLGGLFVQTGCPTVLAAFRLEWLPKNLGGAHQRH